MTKKLKLLGLLLISFILIPLNVKAADYKTLDFRKTLADEDIEEAFKNYKPNSDAITIYMFRGKGCGFCRRYLEFMNSITEEYGKYFKMKTYEVWNDSNNSKLLGEVSEYLGQEAGGVPYIIIGDKVFGGYTEEYNDSIKEAITDLYKTKTKKRYDVFNEMKKHPKKNSTTISDNNTIIWSLVFTFVSTVIIMSYINLKFKELKSELKSNNQDNTKDKPKKPNKKK